MKQIYFSQEQLHWLEEYPNYFIEVLWQPFGKPFHLSSPKHTVQICTLQNFVSENSSKNLWRSWKVYRDQKLRDVIGELPLVIDIDDESEGTANLQRAYDLTHICLEEILKENKSWAKLSSDRLRVVFSGHKGFHIEIKPLHPFDVHKFRQRVIDLCKQRTSNHLFGNVFFEKTAIDKFHSHVRLTGSLNSWANDDGKIFSGKVFQISVEDFDHLKLDGILKISEGI